MQSQRGKKTQIEGPHVLYSDGLKLPLGPSIKYVTLLLAAFNPHPPAQSVTRIGPSPSRFKVRHKSRKTPSSLYSSVIHKLHHASFLFVTLVFTPALNSHCPKLSHFLRILSLSRLTYFMDAPLICLVENQGMRSEVPNGTQLTQTSSA